MKKITKTNFQGLRQLFPVLEKEEMRHYVGGSSDGYYYNSGWNGCGDYYGFPGSGDSSYYSQYDFDNWEGPWYGGWVEGMGWVAPDAYIYGHKPGGNPYEYPYWCIMMNLWNILIGMEIMVDIIPVILEMVTTMDMVTMAKGI